MPEIVRDGVDRLGRAVWQAKCLSPVRLRSEEDHMAAKKMKPGKKLGSKTLMKVYNLGGRKK